MSQRRDPTPELTMLDSLPSTPEPSSSYHIELPAGPSADSIPVDPHFTDMLSIFVDNIFEKDPHSQPYLIHLTEAEKADLKSQLVSSRSFIMSVQRENHAGLPWDPAMDNCTRQPTRGSSEFHLDATTKQAEVYFTDHADSDPTLFPAFDLSSYFEFHGSNPDTGLPKMSEDWATLMDSVLEDLPTTSDAVQEHGHAS